MTPVPAKPEADTQQPIQPYKENTNSKSVGGGFLRGGTAVPSSAHLTGSFRSTLCFDLLISCLAIWLTGTAAENQNADAIAESQSFNQDDMRKHALQVLNGDVEPKASTTASLVQPKGLFT